MITVRLAGHVAHLEENRREPAVASMTEPHAERVEHIPEQAREAQDPDPPAFEIDARRREVAISSTGAAAESVARTVIAVVEALNTFARLTEKSVSRRTRMSSSPRSTSHAHTPWRNACIAGSRRVARRDRALQARLSRPAGSTSTAGRRPTDAPP